MTDSPTNPWRTLHNGPYATIWIHRDAEPELQGLLPRRLAAIHALMRERYCAMATPAMSNEQFTSEGRHGSGDHTYPLFAFKSHQARVYGAIGSVKGNKAFFVAAAATKKADKPDKNVLKRAAQRLTTASSSIVGCTI